MESVEPNDFRAFLGAHPRLELICFNGQPAERLFRRKVLPSLQSLRPIAQRVLDSTSPASARITREEKLARWRDALAPFIGYLTPK
jgi:G:T/U-mismatch repair DNA glycosylase